MTSKLNRRLALFGLIFSIVMGGLIGLIGYSLMMQSIQREALARVEDAVNIAERLLEGELQELNPFFTIENEHRHSMHYSSVSEVPEHYQSFFESAIERSVIVRGYVLDPEKGLSMAAAGVDQQGHLHLILRTLRYDNQIVDTIRSFLFSEENIQENHPTVTLFENDRRVATNVRMEQGQRAIGTVVSDEVAQAVLQEGKVWNDRAYVVNRWTLSAYKPIVSIHDRIIGMIYVGLDEEPYLEEGETAAFYFIITVISITLLIALSSMILGKRLARPINELAEAARSFADGKRKPIRVGKKSVKEIKTLVETFNQMADTISAKTKALEESRQEIKEALDQYLEVLGFVAHELKSPVNGAITQLNVIDGGYAGEVPDSLRPSLIRLHKYLDYAHEMALSFNYLSKAESEGFVPSLQSIEDLADDLIQVSIDEYLDQAKRKDMTISLINGHFSVKLDNEMMRIVIDNLLGNAIKYGKENSTIVITVSKDDNQYTIRVKNEGTGVPEERYPDLFKKFSRVKDPKLNKEKGTGLGLYFVKKIVELHKGTVGVNGEYQKWIEFTLTLPLDTQNNGKIKSTD